MFVLVDCNSFYASCEEAFRPELAGRPVVVLSNNDGCVVARNQAAKDIGIGMAEAWHLVASKFKEQNVSVNSSNYTLYADMSRRVTAVLQRYAEVQYQYSIDESFLQFSPGPDLNELGKKIRWQVRKETGIPVSVGIAPTKVLAKAANRIAKKSRTAGGVFVWPTCQAAADGLLEGMKTSDVWGIAGRLAARLAPAGVHNARQLRDMNDDTVKHLLTVTGLRLVYELRGTSCIEIDETVPPKKAILCSRSFGRETNDLAEVRAAVATFAGVVCEKLRRQNSVAGWIQVSVGTNPFKPEFPQYHGGMGRQFLTPTNFTPEVTAAATSLLERIFRPGLSYKRAGVMLLEIGPEQHLQLAFTSPPAEETQRQRRLMAAVDVVNRNFGRGSVRLAATKLGERWHMRQANRSGRFTTRWEELPVLQA